MSEKPQNLVSEVEKRKQLLGLSAGMVVRIPLDFIEAFALNPRKFFDENDIALQAEYIQRKGDVINPIHVVIRERKGSPFVMIVDGERRFRSSKKAGIKSISCFIKPDRPNGELFRDSFVANLNRKEMSPIEEALAVKRMMDEEELTQAQVGVIVGRQQAQISALLKYLRLHKEVQSILLQGKIDKGIAIYIASFPQDEQLGLLRKVEEEVQRRERKLNISEAWGVILGIAKKHGIHPVNGGKGRKHSASEEITCRKVIRFGNQMRDVLAELAKTTDKQLTSQQAKYLFTIVNLFKEILPAMERQRQRLDELD